MYIFYNTDVSRQKGSVGRTACELTVGIYFRLKNGCSGWKPTVIKRSFFPAQNKTVENVGLL